MNKTVKELKALCKKKGIKGYSKLKKRELIEYCIDKNAQNQTKGPPKKTKSKIDKKKEQQKSNIMSLCDKWKINKNQNPKTNRKIKLNGPTYKKFQMMCKNDSIIIKKSKSPKIPKNIRKLRRLPKQRKEQGSIKTIDTSIIRMGPRKRTDSPDFIIGKLTKRSKTEKISSGTPLIDTLSFIYLMKKHKNMSFVSSPDFERKTKLLLQNKIQINELTRKDYYTAIRLNPIDATFNSIKFPYPMKEMIHIFISHQKSKHRFLFLFAGLQLPSLKKNGKVIRRKLGHANILVYDKFDNTIYRFDPNGNLAEGFNDKTIDEELEKVFKNFKIKYKSLGQFCPLIKEIRKKKRIRKYDSRTGVNRYGPQVLEKLKEDRQTTDPGGFCGYWSMYFMDFLLTNEYNQKYKYFTTPDILKDMIIGINKKFRSYSQFIRTFAVFINTAAINISKGQVVDKYMNEKIKEMKL